MDGSLSDSWVRGILGKNAGVGCYLYYLKKKKSLGVFF